MLPVSDDLKVEKGYGEAANGLNTSAETGLQLTLITTEFSDIFLLFGINFCIWLILNLIFPL